MFLFCFYVCRYIIILCLKVGVTRSHHRSYILFVLRHDSSRIPRHESWRIQPVLQRLLTHAALHLGMVCGNFLLLPVFLLLRHLPTTQPGSGSAGARPDKRPCILTKVKDETWMKIHWIILKIRWTILKIIKNAHLCFYVYFPNRACSMGFSRIRKATGSTATCFTPKSRPKL